jgi:hypothetical protein
MTPPPVAIELLSPLIEVGKEEPRMLIYSSGVWQTHAWIESLIHAKTTDKQTT